MCRPQLIRDAFPDIFSGKYAHGSHRLAAPLWVPVGGLGGKSEGWWNFFGEIGDVVLTKIN